MPVKDFFRSYDSVVEAFDAGYDMGKDKEEGDITIDSGMINHMIFRLRATQDKFGRQQILSDLIKELGSLYLTVKEYEKSSLILEDIEE